MSHMELPDQVSAALGADLPWPDPAVAAAISAFVDRGPFGVAVFDTDLRVLLVSQGLATLHGREASKIVGKKIEEVLPAPYGDQTGQRLRQVLSSGIPEVDTETWGTFSDPHADRSFTSSFYRLDDASGSALGLVVLVTETTELRSAVTVATSAAAQLELLERVTEVLSGNHKVSEVTRTVLTGAAQAVAASAAVLIAVKDDNLVPLASVGLTDVIVARLQQPAALDAHLPHCDALRSRTITRWGSRAERDIEYPDLVNSSADHQAWAFVPMLADDRGIGVVAFAWRLDREFGESDVSLLGAVGRQCALALEQARVLDAEREARRAMEFLVEVTKFVVEGSDQGVFAMSTGNRILTFNRRFCELMGLSESDVHVGADASDLLSHCMALVADPGSVIDHLAAGRDRPFDQLSVDFELKDGRVMACSASPIIDRREIALGRVWYLRDETQRRAQDAEQRRRPGKSSS